MGLGTNIQTLTALQRQAHWAVDSGDIYMLFNRPFFKRSFCVKKFDKQSQLSFVLSYLHNLKHHLEGLFYSFNRTVIFDTWCIINVILWGQACLDLAGKRKIRNKR